MEIEYDGRFTRDLRRVRNQQIFARVQRKIEELKGVSSLGDVTAVEKLRSIRDFHRIRIGTYRLGIELKGNKVKLVGFRHRREFYRSFP